MCVIGSGRRARGFVLERLQMVFLRWRGRAPAEGQRPPGVERPERSWLSRLRPDRRRLGQVRLLFTSGCDPRWSKDDSARKSLSTARVAFGLIGSRFGSGSVTHPRSFKSAQTHRPGRIDHSLNCLIVRIPALERRVQLNVTDSADSGQCPEGLFHAAACRFR